MRFIETQGPLLSWNGASPTLMCVVHITRLRVFTSLRWHREDQTNPSSFYDGKSFNVQDQAVLLRNILGTK